MALYLPLITELKGDGFKKATRGFKELEKTSDKVRYAFRRALVPATALIGALATFGAKALQAGEKAATSNARIRQIATSMDLFGKEVDIVSDRLVELANKTARQIGLDQNAIKETQAKLLTFRNLAKTADQVGGAFDRATQAAIDLAAAGFGEATSNATQLGKALEDPIKGLTALTRSGVTFTEAEKEKIKTLVESGQILEAQNMILSAIEKQVGGTATATANATDKIKVAFSQVTEQLGLALLPVLEKVTPYLLKFAEWAQNNPEKVIAIAGAIGVLGASIIAVNVALAANPIVLLTAAIAGLALIIALNWPKIKQFFIDLRNEIDKTLGPLDELIGLFFEGFGEALGLGKGIFRGPGDPRFQQDIQRRTGNIPRMADGGIVKARNGGTLALIGEGGRDEAVVPLGRGGSAFPTGGITVNVSGALDPVAVGNQIRDILRNQEARFGY